MIQNKCAAILSALALTAALLGGCGKAEPFHEGSWDGTVYSSRQLGLSFSFPEDALIASQEDIDAMLGAGMEMLVGSEVVDGKQAEAAQQSSIYDFVVTLADGASSMTLVYGKQPSAGSAQRVTPAQNLEATRAQLEGIPDLDFQTGEVAEAKLGGKTFSKLSVTALNGRLRQDYYCTKAGDYLATLLVNYSGEDPAPLDEILAGIAPLS